MHECTLALFFLFFVVRVHPSCGLLTSTNAAPHRGLSRHWSRQDFPGLLPVPEGDPYLAGVARGLPKILLQFGFKLKLPAETVENRIQTLI